MWNTEHMEDTGIAMTPSAERYVHPIVVGGGPSEGAQPQTEHPSYAESSHGARAEFDEAPAFDVRAAPAGVRDPRIWRFELESVIVCGEDSGCDLQVATEALAKVHHRIYLPMEYLAWSPKAPACYRESGDDAAAASCS